MGNQPDIQILLPFGMKEIKVIDLKENNGSLTILVQKAVDFGLCQYVERSLKRSTTVVLIG